MVGPAVTIGLPVFNGENYLEAAIETILAQDFGDFELLISDNASTDGTAAICRRYEETDERVRYLGQAENLGAARNFNLLVEEAQGRYFKWASHDDELAPSYLRRCVELLDDDPRCVLATTGLEMIDESGNVLRTYHDTNDDLLEADRPPDRLRELARIDYACFDVFGLMRTDVLRRTDLIDTFITADRSLLVDFGLHGTIRRVDDPLFRPREHSERSTRALATRDRGYWWNAGRSRGINLPHWQLWLAYWRIVARSPISTGEKLVCARHLLWWPVPNAAALAKDIVAVGLGLIRRARDRRSTPPAAVAAGKS